MLYVYVPADGDDRDSGLTLGMGDSAYAFHPDGARSSIFVACSNSVTGEPASKITVVTG